MLLMGVTGECSSSPLLLQLSACPSTQLWILFQEDWDITEICCAASSVSPSWERESRCLTSSMVLAEIHCIFKKTLSHLTGYIFIFQCYLKMR